MVGVADVIELVTAPVRAATNLAIQALGGHEAKPKPVERRSKGWRKHLRKMKAKQSRT